jgi:hypothetical protein
MILVQLFTFQLADPGPSERGLVAGEHEYEAEVRVCVRKFDERGLHVGVVADVQVCLLLDPDHFD